MFQNNSFTKIFIFIFFYLGDGLKEVKDYLVAKAKPGEWLYPENVWTDQSNQTIIEDAVKAVMLDYLPQEIPYNMKIQMEYFKKHDDGKIFFS